MMDHHAARERPPQVALLFAHRIAPCVMPQRLSAARGRAVDASRLCGRTTKPSSSTFRRRDACFSYTHAAHSRRVNATNSAKERMISKRTGPQRRGQHRTKA